MKRFFQYRALRWLVPAALMSMLATGASAQFEGIDKHKLTVKAYVDFGHLVNGYNAYDPDQKKDLAWLPLNRANVIAIQDLAVGRFDVSVGLAGLIWWPYGQGKAADLSEKVMQVKPMIPVARARWQFGDPATTSGSVQVGTFNYKYNPDAKNLGEYLYRSGTYPGILWSGEGWLLMNRAGNYSHGLLATVSQMGGALKHNFSMFMETVYYPVGDFSPGYDVGYSSKWFDVGAGSVFNHYIPMRPSTLSPNVDLNTYVEYRGKTAGGADTIASGRLDQVTPPATTLDTTLTRWTFKGIKVMARGALNLGHLLPEDIRGPEDLRIFAEVALLGVKDYPLYYTKKSERMPIMFGMNVPTAKLLDVLTLQGELYKSPYNDGNKFIQQSLPTWETSKGDSVHRDDFKWSITARKSVNKMVNVHLQAACDHFRLTDGKFSASNIPLTQSWNHDWYYLLRLEFNLR
ncbi:MAG: hypothetical protein JWP91_4164 [Fibrobacteres bacterium]|nr:hypothetical protein [Fibrobacterota bacterium]